MSAPQRLLLLLCSLMACSILPASSQSLTRSGSEFSVLDPQRGDQSWPEIDLDATGGYIVWQDNAIDGQRAGIGAQRLNSAFNSLGDIFRVNYTAAGAQERPDVALLADGGAVVVWQGGTPGFQQIYARFIKPDGSFLTRDVVLGERTSSTTKKWTANRWIWVQNKLRRQRLQHRRTVRLVREANQTPQVIALPDGGAVVVYAGIRKSITNATDWIPHFTWRSSGYFTNSMRQTVTTRFDNMHDIVMQRLSASGEKVGPEITVNQFTDFNQRSPAAALLPDGNLLVVWVSEQEFARPVAASLESILDTPGIIQSPTIGRILGENRVVISARIVTPAGTPVTDEFRVDGESTRVCGNPGVSVLPDGTATVVWNQRDSTFANGWDVYARSVASDGTLASDATRVNTHQFGDQAGPRIATMGANQFVLWTSMGQDGSREGVYGRLLSAGVPVGNELRVNVTTRNAQRQPAVSAANGEFFTLWSSFSGVANGMELMGQRFTSTSATLTQQGDSTSGDPTTGQTGQQNNSEAPIPPISGSGGTAAAFRVNLQGTADKLSLTWNTVPGAVYQIQSSTNLINWADLGAERTAAGTADSLKFESAPGGSFYRVKRIR